MRALPAAAALAIALVACGSGADTSRLGPAAPAASQAASPSATQPIDLSDMMGLYATQTVFVADTDKISAITLLNHFTRYTIPTQGKAQVAADAYGSFGTPTASSTACSLSTGSAPGRARHTGHMFEFGGAPKSVGHPQNAFVRVFSCTWTSSPTTIS